MSTATESPWLAFADRNPDPRRAVWLSNIHDGSVNDHPVFVPMAEVDSPGWTHFRYAETKPAPPTCAALTRTRDDERAFVQEVIKTNNVYRAVGGEIGAGMHEAWRRALKWERAQIRQQLAKTTVFVKGDHAAVHIHAQTWGDFMSRLSPPEASA